MNLKSWTRRLLPGLRLKLTSPQFRVTAWATQSLVTVTENWTHSCWRLSWLCFQNKVILTVSENWTCSCASSLWLCFRKLDIFLVQGCYDYVSKNWACSCSVAMTMFQRTGDVPVDSCCDYVTENWTRSCSRLPWCRTSWLKMMMTAREHQAPALKW